MKTKRQFPLGIVLTLTTGKLLIKGGFSQMHELAEFVMGHPIWIHEFGEKTLWREMAGKIFAQHPQLRGVSANVVNCPEACEPFIKAQVERFGAMLMIESGEQERTESPLESLERIAPGKPVIVIVEDDGKQN